MIVLGILSAVAGYFGLFLGRLADRMERYAAGVVSTAPVPARLHPQNATDGRSPATIMPANAVSSGCTAR